MKREPRGKPAPRIGRKDLQDPDRDTVPPGEDEAERDGGRGDRDAGADRPVPLDDEAEDEPSGPPDNAPKAK